MEDGKEKVDRVDAVTDALMGEKTIVLSTAQLSEAISNYIKDNVMMEFPFHGEMKICDESGKPVKISVLKLKLKKGIGKRES